MKLSVRLRIALLVALSVTFGACGPAGSREAAQSMSSGGPDAATSAAVKPSLDGGMPNALPCNIHTGFPGDERCILPPDPALGFQFHYGPADYNNTEEVKNYTLAPGGEVTDCVYVPLPNEKTVLVNEYHGRMRPGSHHFIFFTQTKKIPETGPTDPPDPTCGTLSGSMANYVMGAQQAVLDIVGNVDGAPENNGMAQSSPPNLQGILQYHFINSTAKPILREGWVNIVYADPAKVTQLSNQIFFVAGYGMNVAQGTSATIHGSATVPSNAGADFRVLSLAPHSHTHTTHWTVNATIGGQQTLLMETFPALHVIPEPGVLRYDSVTQNPAPNPSARLAGGYSGILALKPGDTIDWSCDITNDDVPGGIVFANSVLTAEMCNLFGFYAQSTGAQWGAFNQ